MPSPISEGTTLTHISSIERTVSEDDYDCKGSSPEPRAHFLIFKRSVWGDGSTFFETVKNGTFGSGGPNF